MLPAILVSFYYLPYFLEQRHLYAYRDLALDSGAFTAHNRGVEISVVDYIEAIKIHRADETMKLVEVFALDVIGDWKASLANTKRMWKAGIEAIPCYHVGEPWDVLTGLARDYPKIALGGAVGYRRKNEWAAQCFARVWPTRIHGFGWGVERAFDLPWHSIDATSWEINTCRYGQWRAFGNESLSIKGRKQDLRAEVDYYLRQERRARGLWASVLESELGATGPTIRLALAGENKQTYAVGGRIATAFGPREGA